MKQQLKASSKSSNFWTGIGTLATVLSGALYATLSQDPEAIKTMSFTQFISIFAFQASNIIYHLNKEK